jgi:FkbM family methyltransferase
VVLKEVAVSDRCGTVDLLADDQSGATSQISEIYESSGESSIGHTYGIKRTIEVQTTTLDAVMERGCSIPDLLKMDIEEAEVLALQGAEKLLSAGKTIVVFECHRHEAIELLKIKNWSVYLVDQSNNYLALPPQLAGQATKITSRLVKV